MPLIIAGSLKTASALMHQTVLEEPWRESIRTESRSRDRKETSSKHKGKESKDKSTEKD